MRSTGTSLSRMPSTATLPSTRRLSPLDPRVLLAMKSTCSSRATCRIVAAVSAFSITRLAPRAPPPHRTLRRFRRSRGVPLPQQDDWPDHARVGACRREARAPRSSLPFRARAQRVDRPACPARVSSEDRRRSARPVRTRPARRAHHSPYHQEAQGRSPASQHLMSRTAQCASLKKPRACTTVSSTLGQ
jgi:hypothetical protein